MTSQPTAEPKSARALRMLMWLYIGSMIMIFAGLTSAYLVRKGEGAWLSFELPWVLYLSTAVLLLSSLTVHRGVRAAEANRLPQLQLWLWVSCLLAIVFIFLQVLGWQNIVSQGFTLVNERTTGRFQPAAGFLFVLTGAHLLHLVAGIVALVVVLVRAIQYRVTADRMAGLRLTATFWHALDFLWLYLFLFLLVNHL